KRMRILRVAPRPDDNTFSLGASATFSFSRNGVRKFALLRIFLAGCASETTTVCPSPDAAEIARSLTQGQGARVRCKTVTSPATESCESSKILRRQEPPTRRVRVG